MGGSRGLLAMLSSYGKSSSSSPSSFWVDMKLEEALAGDLDAGEPSPAAHSLLISLDIFDMAEFFHDAPALVPVM
jgi:hypothetical protein